MEYREEQEDLGPKVKEVLETTRQEFGELQQRLDPNLQIGLTSSGKRYYLSQAQPFIQYWQGKPGTEYHGEKLRVSQSGFERELKLLGRKAVKHFLAGRGLKNLRNRQLRELIAYSQASKNK